MTEFKVSHTKPLPQVKKVYLYKKVLVGSIFITLSMGLLAFLIRLLGSGESDTLEGIILISPCCSAMWVFLLKKYIRNSSHDSRRSKRVTSDLGYSIKAALVISFLVGGCFMVLAYESLTPVEWIVYALASTVSVYAVIQRMTSDWNERKLKQKL